MPEYRRCRIEGGVYFFTVVTYQRRPIFKHEKARGLLHKAWLDVNSRYLFKTDAICLLPDHRHCIWTLPPDDGNYSLRWGEIKRVFSKSYLQEMGNAGKRSESRRKRGEAAIWQRRFWEHTIYDEDDYRRHLDYIHYNPVKHGYVKKTAQWKCSSFHHYVSMEFYDENWGEGIERTLEKLVCEEG